MNPIVNFSPSVIIEGSKKVNSFFKKTVDSFLGIRYATAKRFAEPKPFVLEGKYLADSYGKIAPQRLDEVAKQYFPLKIPGNESMSEDCLHLNIWRPGDMNKNERLPVMVWFHGGSFTQGFSNIFVGDAFCCVNRVILVSCNYRLGFLGFACAKDGSLEGNYGFLDQIEALKWVCKYIEEFGGDKRNVTIFGESAGGMSVSLHLISELSKGLFHKAICQSGAAYGQHLMWSRNQASKLLLSKAKRIGYTGKDNGKELRDFLMRLPSKDIVEMMPRNGALSAVIDGKFLKENHFEIIKKGPSNIPLMIGCTNDEGSMFIIPFLKDEIIVDDSHYCSVLDTIIRKMFFRGYSDFVLGRLIDRIKEVYAEFGESYEKRLSKIYGDAVFISPSYKFAEIHKEHATVYQYELHYRPSFSIYPSWTECLHGFDIPFVFGEPFLGRFEYDWPRVEQKLSFEMMRAWGEFARKGKIEDVKSFNDGFIKLWNYGNSAKTIYNDEIMKFWNHEVKEILRKDSHSKL